MEHARRARCRAFGPAAILFAFALLPATLWAQSTSTFSTGGGAPLLAPDPYVVGLSASPGPLASATLIQAALVLSGADPSAIAADTARLDRIILDLSHEVAAMRDPYRRADAVLEYLHARLLTSYDATQARLDILLATGRFNCVSSAVLYLILGRAVGLSVEAAYTPDHAFCTVDTGGKLVDVETTNRYGFDPGTKKTFRDAFGVTGFTYVPPGDYLLRNATNARGLLSFILQDRMALLERRRDFADAVGLAINRYTLLRNEATYNDGANEIANYCSALNDQGRYSEALDFLRRATRSYGAAPILRRAGAILAQNQVAKLSRGSAFSEALAVIREAQADGWIDAAAASSLRADVAERRVTAQGRTLPFSEAVSAATRSYREGELPDTFYRDYLYSLYVSEAQAVARGGDYLRAAAVLDEGEQLSGDPRFARGRTIYLNDYAATVHNRFAALYNAGNARAAIPLLREALATLPGNAMLANDLQMAERATGSRH